MDCDARLTESYIQEESGKYEESDEDRSAADEEQYSKRIRAGKYRASDGN